MTKQYIQDLVAAYFARGGVITVCATRTVLGTPQLDIARLERIKLRFAA